MHNFAELLLGQMEAVLNGDAVSFICRKCTDKNKKKTQWPDISANDYIHRPEELEELCFAAQTSMYSKAYKLERKSNEENAETDPPDNDELEFMVGEDHPGYGYAYMRENRHRKIPLVSIPEGFMCRIKDLHIGSNEVDAEVEKTRERYAKTALMMFHPFRCLEDLQTNSSYWEMFDFCRTKHFASNDMRSSKESQPTIDWDPGVTSFSKKGFEILQNIDNQMTVSKSNVRTVDRLTSKTECKEEEGEEDTNKKDLDDENNVQDISFSVIKTKKTEMRPTVTQRKVTGITHTHLSLSNPMQVATELLKHDKP